MTDLAPTEDHDVVSTRARILLYSDDAHTREGVGFAVGPDTHGRQVRWSEVATHDAVITAVESQELDLLILDGESAPSGGMGLCRQLKHEIYHCPPVLLLVGRPDDAWLASWSIADAAVAHPLDPFAVKESVDAFFAPPADRET